MEIRRPAPRLLSSRQSDTRWNIIAYVKTGCLCMAIWQHHGALMWYGHVLAVVLTKRRATAPQVTTNDFNKVFNCCWSILIFSACRAADTNTKLSWCWQTRVTRLEVNQGHQTGAIPYVRYSFLLCNSNFVFPIFDFKNSVTLTTGLRVRQCYWKCRHAIQCIRLPIDVL